MTTSLPPGFLHGTEGLTVSEGAIEAKVSHQVELQDIEHAFPTLQAISKVPWHEYFLAPLWNSCCPILQIAETLKNVK